MERTSKEEREECQDLDFLADIYDQVESQQGSVLLFRQEQEELLFNVEEVDQKQRDEDLFLVRDRENKEMAEDLE